MTLEEIARFADLLRAKGVSHGTWGDVSLTMGAEPRPAANDAPAPSAMPTERPVAPIGPDGRPMSEYDRMLFAHQLGEEEASQ